MAHSRRIVVTEESQIGEARRCAAELVRQLGGDEEGAGRLAIATMEAATNLVRHGGGGEILLRKLRASEGSGIDLLALDRGPGMANVAACLRDGHSSGGTAGTGLGAIRRLAEAFEILSLPHRGTALWCRFRLERPEPLPRPTAFEIGAVNFPLATEEVSGDCWATTEQEARLRLMLADGLGHGPYAHEAGRAAIIVFRRETSRSLVEVMEMAHSELHKTRGAAVSVAEICPGLATVTACGIGNVAMQIVQETGTHHLITNRGTVGGSSAKPQAFTYPWSSGSLLVMHSDGIGTQWKLTDYPGLLSRHPGLVAGVLYRDFRRERDDATVVVIRHRRP